MSDYRTDEDVQKEIEVLEYIIRDPSTSKIVKEELQKRVVELCKYFSL